MTTKGKAAKKPERFIGVRNGIVRITVKHSKTRKEEFFYRVSRLVPLIEGTTVAEDVLVFRLTKLGVFESETYLIDLWSNQCNCKGFQYHQHCKHISGLRSLWIEGRI